MAAMRFVCHAKYAFDRMVSRTGLGSLIGGHSAGSGAFVVAADEAQERRDGRGAEYDREAAHDSYVTEARFVRQMCG